MLDGLRRSPLAFYDGPGRMHDAWVYNGKVFALTEEGETFVN
jgi:hypothetical protein